MSKVGCAGPDGHIIRKVIGRKVLNRVSYVVSPEANHCAAVKLLRKTS